MARYPFFTKLIYLSLLVLLPFLHPYLPQSLQNYPVNLAITGLTSSYLFFKLGSAVNPTPKFEIERGPIASFMEQKPCFLTVVFAPVALSLLSLYKALSGTAPASIYSTGTTQSLYILIPIFLVSTALRFLAVNTLGRNFVHAAVTPKELIMTGPYAYVRDPSYIAALVMGPVTYVISGLGVLGVVWSWGLGAFTFMVLLPWFIERLRIEEELMGRNLKGYLEYKKRVPWRFVPGVW
jgi:protein-S-isoprenylcysteine O-methyltransferase Ste14